MRNIAPDIYCLIRKHLFAHVCSRTWLAVVLLRCISCVVRIPAAGMLEKIIKHVWQKLNFIPQMRDF